MPVLFCCKDFTYVIALLKNKFYLLLMRNTRIVLFYLTKCLKGRETEKEMKTSKLRPMETNMNFTFC